MYAVTAADKESQLYPHALMLLILQNTKDTYPPSESYPCYLVLLLILARTPLKRRFLNSMGPILVEISLNKK